MSRRNYRISLDIVESGFLACWTNVQDLIKGAKILNHGKLHALALSTSVLALEEMGKLFCLDGLLYARAGDEKARTFEKSLKSHSLKLSALMAFPMFLGQLASVDPRYGKDRAFNMTVAISIRHMQECGNALFSMLENETFQDLDGWKQAGFYAGLNSHDNVFKIPAETVPPELSDAVYALGWRAASMLDFLLKDGGLKRYIENARTIRERLTEEQHVEIATMAEALLNDVYPDSGDPLGEGAGTVDNKFQ